MHNKNKWDNDDDYDNKTSYMHHKKNVYSSSTVSLFYF